eukprot:m.43922 g.43922  ORF g.43922 m.43922 type:complete len:237 (+) comp14865_c0_seq2:77-787(+)
MLSAKRPDMEAPDVRNSYRMDHHIRHWASQARSVGRLLDLDMDTGGPAVLVVAVAPHVAPPLASELMHATRAEEIQRRIADDCRWATAGIAREKARHRVLQAILEGFRKELARLLPIVQAEEAKACGDEVRDLSNELEKVDDELATRKLQLNFTQSDCTALVTSRDRLEAQLSQASKKVTAEGTDRTASLLLHSRHASFSFTTCKSFIQLQTYVRDVKGPRHPLLTLTPDTRTHPL